MPTWSWSGTSPAPARALLSAVVYFWAVVDSSSSLRPDLISAVMPIAMPATMAPQMAPRMSEEGVDQPAEESAHSRDHGRGLFEKVDEAVEGVEPQLVCAQEDDVSAHPQHCECADD